MPEYKQAACNYGRALLCVGASPVFCLGACVCSLGLSHCCRWEAAHGQPLLRGDVLWCLLPTSSSHVHVSINWKCICAGQVCSLLDAHCLPGNISVPLRPGEWPCKSRKPLTCWGSLRAALRTSRLQLSWTNMGVPYTLQPIQRWSTSPPGPSPKGISQARHIFIFILFFS